MSHLLLVAFQYLWGARAPWDPLTTPMAGGLNHGCYFLTIFVPGGQICPLLSYFNIAPKLKKSFALMLPDF